MVAKEKSSATKARSHLLCCFIGSPVSDSDELDKPLCGSSSKAQHNSLWSKFRREKKAVPINAATENVEIQGGELSERDVLKKIPDKFMSAKKDYFHKFHEKTSSNRSDSKVHRRQHQPILTSRANVEKESPKKPKCVTPRQQELEVQISPISTSLAESKTTNNTKARRKRRLGESYQQIVALLIVAVMLGTMMSGGRVLAIFCTSAWFYLSPYVKDMAKVKVASNSTNYAIRSRAKMIHD